MKQKKIKEYFPAGSFCFVCGVDSTDLKIFVFGTIGFLVLAGVFTFFGLYLKGTFRGTEALNNLPNCIEEEENGQP